MPVAVERIYAISFNESAPWRVPSDGIKRVDGSDFIKVKPYDLGLIKLVCTGLVEIPKKARPSLAQCPGFKSLIELRNRAASDEVPQPSVAEMLFKKSRSDPKPDKKARKTPKLNAAKLQELREAPSVFDFEVPGVEDAPALMVTALKPIHPCDELCIKCDSGSIEQIIQYVRGNGLDLDSLLNKRQYGNEHGNGVWRNGSAGLVRKVDPCDCWDGESKKRFKTCNDIQIDAPEPTPLPSPEDVRQPHSPAILPPLAL